MEILKYSENILGKILFVSKKNAPNVNGMTNFLKIYFMIGFKMKQFLVSIINEQWYQSFRSNGMTSKGDPIHMRMLCDKKKEKYIKIFNLFQ